MKASGELGPLDANASGAVTLGAEQYKNGDTKVKVALTAKAAGDLGIPLPEQVLALQSSGDASLVVTADLTFDSAGQVVKVAGSVVGTVTGEVEVGANTDLVKDLPINKKTTVKSVDLPPFLEGAKAGTQFQVNFSTDFRRDDGSVDHSAVQALSEGLQNFVTTGEGLSPDQVAALRGPDQQPLPDHARPLQRRHGRDEVRWQDLVPRDQHRRRGPPCGDQQQPARVRLLRPGAGDMAGEHGMRPMSRLSRPRGEDGDGHGSRRLR